MDQSYGARETLFTSSPARELYKKQLQNWITYEENTREGSNSPVVTSEYFKKSFLSSIKRQFRVKVVIDNLAAEVLVQIVQESPIYWKFLQDQFSLSKNKTPRNCIEAIGQCLYKGKFISKSKYRQIIELLKEDTPFERGLKSLVAQIGEKDSTVDLELLWDQFVPLGLLQFWAQTLRQHPILANQGIILFLFESYKGILSRQLQLPQYREISAMFEQKSPLNRTLESIAHMNDLFHTSLGQQVSYQVEDIKHKILAVISCHYKNGERLSIEAYGSYRSNFCLLDSDVDLSILIRDREGNLNTEKKFIIKNMWKIVHLLEEGQDRVQFIQKAQVIHDRIKVPFITLQFEETRRLRSVDLVVNNLDGVHNSSLLEYFSRNPTIQKAGLLIKKWAKVNNLIGKCKLSSYGVLLMMIFYLMKHQYLYFITMKQLHFYDFPIQFNKQLSLHELLKGFFQYYSKNGDFLRNQDYICLIEGCSSHQSYNPQFIYNMHDPFDNSNPGRLKQKDSTPFLISVDKVRAQMKSKSEEDCMHFKANNRVGEQKISCS